MIGSFALRLSRPGEEATRWHQFSATFGAVAAAVAILVAVSILSGLDRQASRVEGREAVVGADSRPTDLYLLSRDDSWRGKQFLVVWLEPATDVPPTLPPGVEVMPKPGQSVVSPGLASLMQREPELASRYPDALVIRESGVKDPTELLAYVRPMAGRSIADDPRALRVGSFGGSTSYVNSFSVPLVHTPPPDLLSAALAATGFLVLPGLVVLFLGVLSASRAQSRRIELLRWLGASAWHLRLLASCHTLTRLFVPTSVTALLWFLAAPRLQAVPLVGQNVFRGDLAVSPLLTTFLPFLVLTVGAVYSVLIVRSRISHPASASRPVSSEPRVSVLRGIPLAAGLGLIGYSSLLDGYVASLTWLAALLCCISGVYVLAPLVINPLGALIGQVDAVSTLLAGRFVQWEVHRAARPFGAVATLVVLAFAAVGYIALITDTGDEPAAATDVAAVTIRWLDAEQGDIQRFARTLPTSDLVVPIHPEGDSVVMTASCTEVSAILGAVACSPGGVLTDEAARVVGTALGLIGSKPRLGAVPESSVPEEALVLSDSSGADLLERVRTGAAHSLVAATAVSALSFTDTLSPLVMWIQGGIAAATALLALSVIFTIIDGLISTRGRRAHLSALGAANSQIRRIETIMFVVPYLGVSVVSLVVGAGICSYIIQSVRAPWPGTEASVIMGALVAGGIAGTLVIRVFGLIRTV